MNIEPIQIERAALNRTIETIQHRLSKSDINADDARGDAREIFGIWRLAVSVVVETPALAAINRLHWDLGDAAAHLRATDPDPDATLAAVYKAGLERLEQTT